MFFRWSMRDPINYWEPEELSFSCRNDVGGICRFPQDVRSQSYWGELLSEESSICLWISMVFSENSSSTSDGAYFPMFHPYIYGYKAGRVETVALTKKYEEQLVCGVIKPVRAILN